MPKADICTATKWPCYSITLSARPAPANDPSRSVGCPNDERAHPDGHAVREVRVALEHQVVSPGWFVRDANDSEIHVCLCDRVRSPAPDVVQTALRSGAVADEQVAVDTNRSCGGILGRYRGASDDFAGEWDHDLAAAAAVV